MASAWPNRLRVACLALFLGACAACAGLEQAAPGDNAGRAGMMRDGVYQNGFFKFTWQPPAGYSPMQPRPPAKPLFYSGPVEQVLCAWREPQGQSETGLMVYGPNPELPTEQPLTQAAEALGRWQQWRQSGQHAGAWEGQAVLDVLYEQRDAQQPGAPHAVMVRLLRLEQDLLVFFLLTPTQDFDPLRAKFLALMEGVRFMRPALPAPPEPARTPPPDLVHTVRHHGETPAHIAQWYTGRAENWRSILKHNNLNSSAGLKIGQQVVIPGEMVVNREPLPKPRPKRQGPTSDAGRQTGASPAEREAEPAGGQADKGLLLEPTGPR
jgi:hypothetical protein